jgi:fructose-specific phosphotransferase system IIC component
MRALSQNTPSDRCRRALDLWQRHFAAQSSNSPPVMNKSLTIVLIVGGILLAGFGIYTSVSNGGDFSSLFTNVRSNKPLWAVLAGLIAFIVGSAGWIRSQCSR